MDNVNRYEWLTRFGKCYGTTFKKNISDIKKELKIFDDKWVKYNPRKDIPRYGLSVTSLDGNMTGRPDLDSFKEVYKETGHLYSEMDFVVKTPVYEIFKDILNPFGEHLGRTHVIKHKRGGMFPPHRDLTAKYPETFRMFLPIKGCNPPVNYFILDNKILNFDHGNLYFIDSAKEHTVMTPGSESIFLVANIRLCTEAIDVVLDNLAIH